MNYSVHQVILFQHIQKQRSKTFSEKGKTEYIQYLLHLLNSAIVKSSSKQNEKEWA